MTTGDTGPNKALEVVLIVAMARNRVIGKDGELPWHIPEDLKRFRQLTMGHPIIMGRKTWDSIGRPLPGRRNIVVTRNRELELAGAETARSFEEALALTAGEETVFVIGGEQIYRAALPLATRIEMTVIENDVQGDAYFPEFDEQEWLEQQRIIPENNDGTGNYAFVTLARQRADNQQ